MANFVLLLYFTVDGRITYPTIRPQNHWRITRCLKSAHRNIAMCFAMLPRQRWAMVLLSVVVHRDEVGAAACPMAETGNDAGVKHGGADLLPIVVSVLCAPAVVLSECLVWIWNDRCFLSLTCRPANSCRSLFLVVVAASSPSRPATRASASRQ